jgi:hypothetical protein
MDRLVPHGTHAMMRRLRGRVLAQGLTSNGYPLVNLSRLGVGGTLMVHVLVAEAFIGPRPDGLHVCHNDGVPTNNRADNLRYDTPKGNHADRLKHGTSNRGENHGQARLTAEDVRAIRAEYAAGGVTQQAIADRYRVSRLTVGDAINRRTWAHLY